MHWCWNKALTKCWTPAGRNINTNTLLFSIGFTCSISSMRLPLFSCYVLNFSLSLNSILTLLPSPLTDGPPSFSLFLSLSWLSRALLRSSSTPLFPQSTVDKVNLNYSAHPMCSNLSYSQIFTSAIMHQQVLIPSSPLRFPLKGFIYKGSYWVWFSMVNTARLYHSHINLERASCWKIKVKRKQLLHPQWVQVPGHMSWSERIRVDIRKMEGNKTPKPNRSIKG